MFPTFKKYYTLKFKFEVDGVVKNNMKYYFDLKLDSVKYFKYDVIESFK